jgi:solute carrier family 25 phosphate transporter 23/24/25/41
LLSSSAGSEFCEHRSQDTVRLRLALPNSVRACARASSASCARELAAAVARQCADTLPQQGYTGMRHAFATMYRVEGVASLFKGLGPTLIGIAPYAALNFATYDMVKKQYYGSGAKQSTVSNLVLGGLAGTFAASACYPLDTVRRRMQMKGKVYDSMPDALRTIWRVEGARGFYRGWAANTLKVAPMSAIRFVCYEALKGLLGVQKKSSDT